MHTGRGRERNESENGMKKKMKKKMMRKKLTQFVETYTQHIIRRAWILDSDGRPSSAFHSLSASA